MCTKKKDCKYNRLNSIKHEQEFHFDLELIFTRCGVHLLKHAILGCLSFVRIGWLDWLVHKCDASVLPILEVIMTKLTLFWKENQYTHKQLS